MPGGESIRFGFGGRARRAGSLSRRESILGIVAILAVVAVFATFAIIRTTTESEKPEIVAGTFFVPYYNDDPVNGAVGFSAVDGGLAGRLSKIPELVAQSANNQQWVEVYNTQAGSFLMDRQNGNVTLVLPTIATANKIPTRLGAPSSAPAGIVANASVMGFPTDDGLYVVRRGSDGSGYVGDVHLLSASSVSGGVPVGASELPGTMPGTTLVVDESVVAGDPRFAGLGEAGRYTDSLATVTTGGALWMVVDGPDGGRVVRFSAPDAEAIAAFEQAASDPEADGDVPPPVLTIDELGAVGPNAVMTALATGDGVATADPDSGEVSLWLPSGRLRTTSVDGLQPGSKVVPINGGALAWFAVGNGPDWRVVGAGNAGQVRQAAFVDASGLDLAPGVLIGETVFSASRVDGRVVAVGIDSGDSVVVGNGGVYPIDPELDIPALGAGVTPVDYRSVELERHGSRVSVNVPAASRALLLDSDGNVVRELEKGRAKLLDPNIEIDPNVLGDNEPEEDEEPDPDDPSAPTPVPGENIEQREGDSSLRCELDDEQRPSQPIVAPQRPPFSPRSIRVEWRYNLTSSADCLPAFRVEVAEFPNGSPLLRDIANPNATAARINDLKPATVYDVTVIAYLGEFETRSNTVQYRTGDAAPDDPSNLRFTSNLDSWEIEWDACTQSSCDVPATQFEIRWYDAQGGQTAGGESVVSAAAAKRFAVPIDNINVGRELCFTVTAVGTGGTSSEEIVTNPCAVRERAPLGVGMEVFAQPATRTSNDVLVRLDFNSQANFAAVMGTRGSVRVNITFDNIPSDPVHNVAFSFSESGEVIGLTRVPLDIERSGWTARVSNDRGGVDIGGEVVFAPRQCGPVVVNISNTGYSGGRWRPTIVPQPSQASACVGVLPSDWRLIPPPGCTADPLTPSCVGGSSTVDPGNRRIFGYTAVWSNPPGYEFDELVLTGSLTLGQPPPNTPGTASSPSIASLTSVARVATDVSAGAAFYLWRVVITNSDTLGQPVISGCSLVSQSGAQFTFDCSNQTVSGIDPVSDRRAFGVTPGPSRSFLDFPSPVPLCQARELQFLGPGIPSATMSAGSGSCTLSLPYITEPSQPPEPYECIIDGVEYPFGAPECAGEGDEGGLVPLGLLGALGLFLRRFLPHRRSLRPALWRAS